MLRGTAKQKTPLMETDLQFVPVSLTVFGAVLWNRWKNKATVVDTITLTQDS